MRKINLFLLGTFYFLFVFFLIGCKFSSSIEKKPVFSRDIKSINQDIKNLVNSSEAYFDGIEQKANDQITTELTIRIINATNLPKDDAGLELTGKQIAKIVNHSLMDINSYGIYKVLFVVQEINSGIKKSSYTGYVYKKEDVE